MVVPINRNYGVNYMCHVFKSFHNSRPPSRDFATKGRVSPDSSQGNMGIRPAKVFKLSDVECLPRRLVPRCVHNPVCRQRKRRQLQQSRCRFSAAIPA